MTAEATAPQVDVQYGLRDPDGRHWHSPTGYPLEPRPGWTVVVAVPGEDGLYEWVAAT